MRLLFLLLAVLCVTGSYLEEVDDPDRKQIADCANESKVDMKLFDSMYKEPHFIPTREMHCFAACLLKKQNLMDASGRFTETYGKTEIGKACKPDYGKDDCETAGKLMTCINQYDLDANRPKTV